jgi:hypothetical protein
MRRSIAPCSCQSLPLARTGGQALGPRFRGDDGGYYYIAMSIYQTTRGATRAFLSSLSRE